MIIESLESLTGDKSHKCVSGAMINCSIGAAMANQGVTAKDFGRYRADHELTAQWAHDHVSAVVDAAKQLYYLQND